MGLSNKTTNSGIKLVFLGSGPVATASLKLLAQNFQIEAVITKPSTAKDISSTLQDTPIHSVSTKEELDNLVKTVKFQSTLAVLIDFGIIISPTVIHSFKKGIINSHFSLLPEWRGADPISFSILSGQKQTGVSLMLLVDGMDEGPLIAQKVYDLPPAITTPELTNRLIKLSADCLVEYLPLYLADKVVITSQNKGGLSGHQQVSYSRKLTKQNGLLDFSKPASVLVREIRAFREWPKSRMILANTDTIITDAHADPTEHSEKIGVIITTSDKLVGVRCGYGTLIIDSLKPSGKKEMSAKAFLAGYGHKL